MLMAKTKTKLPTAVNSNQSFQYQSFMLDIHCVNRRYEIHCWGKGEML